MVNQGEGGRRPLTLRERAAVLGLTYDRALFLSKCAHIDETHNNAASYDRGNSIPYSDEVALREAARLGIGLRDTADMMNMTPEQVASFGIPFAEKSAMPRPLRGGLYNLLAPDTPLSPL